MALAFDGTSGYLKFTGAVATAMPLTMRAWARMTSGSTGTRYIAGTGKFNATGDGVYCSLAKLTSSLYPCATHRTPGSSRSSIGNVAFPSASFQPVAGIFLATSTQLRYAAPGTMATADTTARTDNLSTHEFFFVGANSDLATPTAGLWQGDIGEVAMWSSDLSEADHDLLDAGALPETVSPSTLIDVWDLLTYNAGGTYTGRVNGKVLTSSGSGISQAATHPISRSAPSTTLVGTNCTQGATSSTGVVTVTPAVAGTVNLAGASCAGGATSSSGVVTVTAVQGTLTSDPFTAWGSQDPLAGLTIPNVNVVRVADRVQVLTLTGQVTNGAGRMILSSPSIVAGVAYMLACWNSDGSQRSFERYVAT